MRLLTLALLAVTAAAPLTPARFAKRPGWHVGAGRVHACPGVKPSRCVQVGSWAATVPWRDCADCAVAPRGLAQLKPNGIAIFILLGRERHSAARSLAWPPRLQAKEAGRFEGVPGGIGAITRGGDLHGFPAQLFVYFGRPHPTPRQLAHAEAELATARLP